MFKAGSWNASVEDRLGDVGDLPTRMSTAESVLLAHDGRIEDLEEWRSNKSSAIANETNMTVSTSIQTGLLTLGANGPIASSIESNFNAIKTEMNNMKSKINLILGSLRTREVINA